MALLEVNDLKKQINNNEILKGVNLSVEKGEVIAVIGPSGSGKTTLLRALNYLNKVDDGTMKFKDHKIDLSKPSEKEILWIRRHTSMVFQNYNLFKNKTALENISEGLIYGQGMKKDEAHKIALEALKKVNLQDKKNYYPSQLSGGQQQRIGIARAVVLNPEIILFDEPTSALDPELVGSVLKDIKRLANEGQTMIVITHQMSFARNVADRVIFFADGNILDSGTPNEIFNHPKSKRAEDFLLAISENQ
ncbi:amino acid ABC transporter ATP-binding protein [Fructilactobacillus frigidiflavus]|uniref:amino acid ABC transporter ATP-binding protein n=1 Tax=Fructilactobacillus frigidiflavus TaxID=3242688 RepID=UPI0037577B40